MVREKSEPLYWFLTWLAWRLQENTPIQLGYLIFNFNDDKERAKLLHALYSLSIDQFIARQLITAERECKFGRRISVLLENLLPPMMAALFIKRPIN